jgi:hypothetical protein
VPARRGYRADADDEPAELAFYCPTCAEREFDQRSTSSDKPASSG